MFYFLSQTPTTDPVLEMRIGLDGQEQRQPLPFIGPWKCPLHKGEVIM